MTRLPHDRNKPFLTLTRQELYKRVWTTPVETLATTLHLSGRGLGKLCNRHSIPVPPRGYWARKAAGQKVIRTPLPQLADRAKGTIRFADKSHTRLEEQMSQQEPAELAFERDPANRVVVNDDLPLTHALIVDAQRRLTRGRRDPQGLSIVRKGGLQIRTSRSLHERTLRLFQALLTAFETRCFEVVPTEECVCVRILEETLGFGFEEELTKVPHRVTFTEQKKIDRGYAWQVPTVDLVPSGKLTFAITNVGGMRRNWSEGSVRPEDRINVFIVGLVRAAINLKRQRAAHAESERERLEQERLRKEEEQRQVEQAFQWREEQGRVERLERLLEVRSRNQRLRTLLAELDAAAGVIDADSELGRWFAWAHEHVEHSDPLTPRKLSTTLRHQG